MGQIDIVVDGQFGSTGKGKLAHYIYNRYREGHYDMTVVDFNTNAGHTSIDEDGVKHVFQQLPMAAIQANIPIFLGPGCGIDIKKLMEEMDKYDCHSLVHIHPNAVVIDDSDALREQKDNWNIASTMKGCGAALCRKIRREATAVASSFTALAPYTLPERDWNFSERLFDGDIALCETSQGYSLSLDGPWYPHCTSRNVNIGAILDRIGGVHPSYVRDVYMSVRTFPIRVGNVVSEGGQVGSSGPFYPDSDELRWDQLPVNVVPEKTTVTGRVRRIATWSDMQFRDSLVALKPDYIFFNFLNYIDNKVSKVRDLKSVPDDVILWLWSRILILQAVHPNIKGILLGTGAAVDDMIETSVAEIMIEGTHRGS